MPKTRLAAARTTAPKKKNTFLTKSGRPRKYSDAWWAEYWNARYMLMVHGLNNLDYHLRMAQGSCVNGKAEQVMEHILSARDSYKDYVHDFRMVTVVEDTQSLTEIPYGLDRGKAQTGARHSD